MLVWDWHCGTEHSTATCKPGITRAQLRFLVDVPPVLLPAVVPGKAAESLCTWTPIPIQEMQWSSRLLASVRLIPTYCHTFLSLSLSSLYLSNNFFSKASLKKYFTQKIFIFPIRYPSFCY